MARSFNKVLSRFSKKTSFNVAQNTVAFAAGGAAQAAIAPEVQPLTNLGWSTNPTIPLSPEILATMVVQSVRDQADAADEATQSGISRDRFNDLVRVSGDPPGPETLLDMADRGYINDEQLTLGLRQSRLKPEWIDRFKLMSREMLTAGQLAEMVVQGVIPEAEAIELARKVSTEPEDFRRMVLLAGSPPGPMETLELWNRGIISETQVELALKQSRLKPEWVDEIKQLKRTPLSASVAAELVLKQRISFEEGLRIAAAQGVTREDFQLLSQVNGRPIAIGQALQLARRGEFTFQQFTEAVARSDVRTEYADDLWKLRRVIPPLFQILRLLTSGAMTPELGTRYITELGYDKELAADIVAAAKHDKTTKTRDLSASMIDVLYESGLESQTWAMEALQTIGYDEEESAFHLMILDARRLVNAANANLSLIHRMYVGHKYDRATATDHLDAMEIRPEVRNQLLDTWTHERDANVSRLSNAQIGSALKKGVIERADAISRWIANGYPRADAEILANIAQSTGHPASPTAP